MLGFPVDRARGSPSSGFSRLTVDDFHARTYFLCETGLEYMPSPPSPGHPPPRPLSLVTSSPAATPHQMPP